MPTDDVLAAVARRLREAECNRTPVAPFAHELGEGDIAAGYAVQDTANAWASWRRNVGLTMANLMFKLIPKPPAQPYDNGASASSNE